MEVTKTMNVSKEEFAAFINDMVRQDVLHASGRKVKDADLVAGFTYRKKLKGKSGKEGKVSTRIEALTPGHYRATFNSKQGVNSLDYHYESVEGGLQVRYVEDFNATSTSQSLNHQLMAILFKRSNKKRIKAMLLHIEQLIQTKQKPA